MPLEPLFDSPRTRSAAIAAIMWSLLAGSLLASAVLTGAPLFPPQSAPPRIATFDGLTLQLPANWTLESHSPAEAEYFPKQWVYVNRSKPAERLRVLTLHSRPPIEPSVGMGQLLPHLVAGRRFIVNHDPPWTSSGRSDEQGHWLSLRFSTQRQAQADLSPQLHAVTMLTPDGHDFWVFQLSDQVLRDHWSRQLEAGNAEQLDRLLRTVRVYRAAGL